MSEKKQHLYTLDSIANNLSGIGTYKDKGAANHFYTKFIDDQTAIEMYRGSWLAAKIVDLPVFQALREWREFTMQDDSDISDKMYCAERKFKVKSVIREAATYARIFGGSAILINVENSGPMETPLDINTIKKDSLKWFVALDKRSIMPVDYTNVYNPASPNFLKPEFYSVASLETNDASSYRIHRSRLIIFDGIDLPVRERAERNFWGDSVYTRLFDAISNADIAQQAISSLIHKSNVDIWKITDLRANLEQRDGASQIEKRVAFNNMMMSIVNAAVIDKDNEEIERTKLDFGSLDKILKDALHICAGASNNPASLLLGTSQDGLNTTGDGDVRNSYDNVRAYQENELRDKIERMDKIMAMSALGYLPEDLSFEFKPLWQPSEKEKAEVEVIKSQRDVNYLNAGIMTPENIARELLQDETYQSLTDDDVNNLSDFSVNNLLSELDEEQDSTQT
jgi:uncharacterized protein